MNLVGTLGKMLLSNAMSGRGGRGNVLGSLIGGALGGGSGGQVGGRTGGFPQGPGGGFPGGGMGGLGGSMGGGAGGLGGMLAGLVGGGAGGGMGGGMGGGGLGGILGSMLGGSASQGGGLGSLLGAALGQQRPDGSQPIRSDVAPEVANEQHDQAALLIRAMVNSAKADGEVDQAEREKIIGKLGDIGQEETDFVRDEMQAPLDVDAFVNSVPGGMERQVYLMSLLSIDLDHQAEAQYLDRLAKGLRIDESTSNELHDEVGAPRLYG